MIEAVQLLPGLESQNKVGWKVLQKVSDPLTCSSWVLVQVCNSQEETMVWWSSHGEERSMAPRDVHLSRTTDKLFVLSLQFLQKSSVYCTLYMLGNQVNPH